MNNDRQGNRVGRVTSLSCVDRNVQHEKVKDSEKVSSGRYGLEDLL